MPVVCTTIARRRSSLIANGVCMQFTAKSNIVAVVAVDR